jgi:hypothetical protein
MVFAWVLFGNAQIINIGAISFSSLILSELILVLFTTERKW